MSRISVATKFALLAGIFGLLASGTEQKSSAPIPKFTARTELVLVPAVVTDKSGAHISGLKQDDFTLLENGSERKITVFEEITTSNVRPQRTPQPKNVYTNMIEAGTETAPRRVTILALDFINTPIPDQAYAKQQLLKYLAESADTSEPIALVAVTRSGMRIIHDFTTDPRVLRAAIGKVRGSPQQGVEASADLDTLQASDDMSAALGPEADALVQAFEQAQQNFTAFQRRVAATYTLEALLQIANAVNGIPGRKALVWCTGGFPFEISDRSAGLSGPRDSLIDVLPLYERTWRSLNDAMIAVYPVDVRGLVNPSLLPASAHVTPRSAPRMMQAQRWAHSSSIDTLETFAHMTGGKAYYNTNDLTRGFRDASRDSASYYLLGFYLEPGNPKPGWHKLAVKVHQPHVQIRARSGFFVTEQALDPAKLRDLEIANALASPFESTAIGISAQWGPIADGKEAGKKRVGFQLDLPANSTTIDDSDNNHVLLEMVAVAKKEDGSPAGKPLSQSLEAHLKPESVAKIRGSGITYSSAIELPPGEYRVRFLVRDGLGGKLGTVSAALKVE